MKLSNSLTENIVYASILFPVGKSFDIITRNLYLGNTPAYWIGINGFTKTEILQQIFSDLQNPLFTKDSIVENILSYMNGKIGFAQCELCNNWEDLTKFVVSGPCALFLDGFDQAIILDTRTYPTRGIQEPDTEQVTKGAKDGFVETLLFNANLIRRRIRIPALTFSVEEVGTDSKTDVAIAYIQGYADESLIHQIRNELRSFNVTALTMGTQSLEELLFPKSIFHPLPNVHQTQRPDVACSFLLEGHILLMVDTTPSALILPCTIFQFTQSPEDYYKNPIIGNYIRFLRFISIVITLCLLPTFLLIGAHMPELANQLNLLGSETIGPIRLFIYILFAELGLDLFQYTCAHTANRFNTSLSIVGGLIIGEIAISLNWLSLEVIFYSAVTLLTSFAISSLEFSEGIRMYRIFLILVTGFWGIPGFILGLFLIFLSIIGTPTFGGKSYFWPLYPFNWKALRTLLFRYPTTKSQPSRVWNRHRKSG